jgi:hypothetical protein
VEKPSSWLSEELRVGDDEMMMPDDNYLSWPAFAGGSRSVSGFRPI